MLGVKNISIVNLNKLKKEREQQLKNKGEWYDPDDEDKPACPSAEFIYSFESWFYY
ncbi:hypothetical protein AB9K36_27280 [Klebsiella michiganensis]|uniref:hypothetical protein n=1 Tax=Klebsiella michiganensis TaxID=1134687 RepID=UPI0015F49252|nr:hypothetical protein [Klebsiella michiganensis]MCZ0062773.1 hypothetical protein [Klebsiella michiganensis]MCZ0078772.1 hypothetical protein [Klebsiella michiganensis]MCZ9441171.1 hypothetical protein [Klebsiella michiganensis]WAT37840.1 hypothetical protein OEE44_15600 [Klebsiella michiganensis]WAX82511.1 hypothetical protein F0A14_015750 [Klebsiella michiganensis]